MVNIKFNFHDSEGHLIDVNGVTKDEVIKIALLRAKEKLNDETFKRLYDEKPEVTLFLEYLNAKKIIMDTIKAPFNERKYDLASMKEMCLLARDTSDEEINLLAMECAKHKSLKRKEQKESTDFDDETYDFFIDYLRSKELISDSIYAQGYFIYEILDDTEKKRKQSIEDSEEAFQKAK